MSGSRSNTPEVNRPEKAALRTMVIYLFVIGYFRRFARTVKSKNMHPARGPAPGKRHRAPNTGG